MSRSDAHGHYGTRRRGYRGQRIRLAKGSPRKDKAIQKIYDAQLVFGDLRGPMPRFQGTKYP